MPNSEELEPCPWCWGKAILTNVRHSGHQFKVGCYNELCWRPGTDYYSCADDAVAAWNARFHPAAGEAVAGLCPICAGTGRGNTTAVACLRCGGTGAIVLAHPAPTAADTPPAPDYDTGFLDYKERERAAAADTMEAVAWRSRIPGGLVEQMLDAAVETWPKPWEEYNLRKALRRAIEAARLVVDKASQQQLAAAHEQIAVLEREKAQLIEDCATELREAYAEYVERAEAADVSLSSAQETIRAKNEALVAAKADIEEWVRCFPGAHYDSKFASDKVIEFIDAALTLAKEKPDA